MRGQTITSANNLVQCQVCGQWVPPNQFHPLECCQSFKAGIKEVVEWLREQDWETVSYRISKILLDTERWQAKLKEWGIHDRTRDVA